MTIPVIPLLILYIGLCSLLGAVSILALHLRGWNTPEARALAIFAWLGIAGLLAQYGADAGWFAGSTAGVLERLPQYLVLLLSWSALGFAIAFTRSGERGHQRWLVGLLPLAVLFALDSNIFNLPDVLWRSPTQVLALDSVTWYTLDGACALTLLSAYWLSIRQFVGTRHPLHRNRLMYLLVVLTLVSAGAILAFNFQLFPALIALLCATVLMTYMAIVHQLPDLKQIVRLVISYLILALLAFGIITASYRGASYIFAGQKDYNPIWTDLAIAVVLAAALNPLLAIIQRLVNRLLSGPAYRSTEVVSEYGQHTSNILDIKRLAATSVGFIRETLRIEQGHLALIDPQSEAGQFGYHLTDVEIEGTRMLEPGFLAQQSPIAGWFWQERRPLTQYDLDLLPGFQNADQAELSWFHATGMDVYIPIIANEAWIGLLLLGPKRSGDRYSSEDLSLLSALASQTAASLENARLVSHLEALNNELKDAYDTLDAAKQKLERMDKVKTDFISIASHELRTPLTLVVGYSDMLAACPPAGADKPFHQTLAGIRSGAGRMQEIIESLLDIARIDSNTLELHLNWVNTTALVRAVQANMDSAYQDREVQYRLIDEPNLPEIEADPNELQKVMTHLSSNALKYTPNGGSVEISIRRLIPANSPLGRSSIEIVYSDTGIGIAPDTCELIFAKFYQTGPVALHSSGKSKFKGGGPGLGLAIVRGIVEAHAGVVWAESEGYDEEKCPGSRFHVVLPIMQPHLAFEDRPTIPIAYREKLAREMGDESDRPASAP